MAPGGEKTGNGSQRLPQVLLRRAARSLARDEAMIAVFEPMHGNRRRQAVAADLSGRAERIARALDDQRRRRELPQVRNPARLMRLLHRFSRR